MLKVKRGDWVRIPIVLRDYFFEDPFFSVNWDKFAQLKESVVHVAKDLWDHLHGLISSVAYSRNLGLEDEGGKRILPFPRKVMFPLVPTLAEQRADLDLYTEDGDNELIRLKEDANSLQVSLDVHQYRPDEVQVSVEGGVLTVQGRHDQRSEDGRRRVCRQFASDLR